MARDVLETIEQAREAAGLLERRTREANAATKDLRAAMREREQLVRTAVRDEVGKLMKAAANEAAELAIDDFALLVRKAEAAMLARLDAIYSEWIKGEEGMPTVPELMAARQRIRKGMEAAEADRARARGR